MSSEEPVAAKDPIPALGEPRDIMTAMQLVLEISALAHDGLAKGLHEGAKVIEKHGVQLCVSAKDCNQPDYVKLVKALCGDHNVSLIIVPHPRHSVNGPNHCSSSKTLGEWAALCNNIDSKGKARKAPHRSGICEISLNDVH